MSKTYSKEAVKMLNKAIHSTPIKIRTSTRPNEPCWHTLIAGYSGKNKDTILSEISELLGREVKTREEKNNLMVFVDYDEMDRISKSGILIRNLY